MSVCLSFCPFIAHNFLWMYLWSRYWCHYGQFVLVDYPWMGMCIGMEFCSCDLWPWRYDLNLGILAGIVVSKVLLPPGPICICGLFARVLGDMTLALNRDIFTPVPNNMVGEGPAWLWFWRLQWLFCARPSCVHYMSISCDQYHKGGWTGHEIYPVNRSINKP